MESEFVLTSVAFIYILIVLPSTLSNPVPVPIPSAPKLPGFRDKDHGIYCGQTPIAPVGGRIVGGEVARPYSWPWQIALDMKFHDISLVCGGSLIDREWVMTAAHCTTNWVDYPERFRIKLGVFDRKSFNETGEVIAEVDKIYLHNQWNPHTIDYDMSLLHLSEPVNYTDHIRPVCLPYYDKGIVVPPHSAFVTGWGALHEADPDIPKELHQVQVPFLNRTRCDQEYGSTVIDDRCMFCAGRTGKDSCQGDSGGPLVVRHGDQWFQYGIVSWGNGCAKPGYAGVYSRVTAYCDFIVRVTGRQLCRA